MNQPNANPPSPVPSRQSGSPGRWGILVFLMALCFISHFNRASITSAGDERIMAQYGISPNEMGAVYSVFLAVYTLFMIPGGWFIDRRGPRVALACMCLGSALFCAITGSIGFGFLAAAQVLPALLIVRALMGLLGTPLHPASARAAGNWFPPEQRALANGLITGASIFAYAVVHKVFGALIDRVDWPRAFVITGGLTALLSLAWLVFAKDHPASPSVVRSQSPNLPGEESSIFSILERPGLILLTLSYSAVGYFQYLFFYWLHYYFDSVLHMSKLDSRDYAGLPNLAMACTMPIGGWLAERAQRRGGLSECVLVPQAGMVLSALFLLLGIFAKDRTWIVVWFTISLGVLGLCEATFWTMAVELGGSRGGTAAAIMNTGGNGIGLLAPMITPAIGQWLGWGWGIGLGAVIGLLGALCWRGIRPGRPTGGGEAS